MKPIFCNGCVNHTNLVLFANYYCFQTEYIKLLGGTDFNAAIKAIIDCTIVRSVQKQLSWAGYRTDKPSLKSDYKAIVDGIHIAMKDSFKDYTIALGEVKIKSILRNAAR